MSNTKANTKTTLTLFRYTGPNSAITMVVEDGQGNPQDMDVILWGGAIVELPPKHEVTLALIHQGYLETVSEAQVLPAPTATVVTEVSEAANAESKAKA